MSINDGIIGAKQEIASFEKVTCSLNTHIFRIQAKKSFFAKFLKNI
jgi:hypothetical protein